MASTNSLTIEIDAKESFDPREFTIEEGLSALFSVDVTATSSNAAVDFETIIGKDAAFAILGRGGDGQTASQRWTGVVSEIHQIRSEDTGLSTYHLSIVPKVWLLTQRTNCRVFQQLSDLEIVQQMLTEWGITPVTKTTRSYKTRKYRVQYQEADYTFISRLMEAAGITLMFQRTDKETQVVLHDAPETGEARKAPLDHVNTPNNGMVHATNFRASRAVRSGKLVFSDHDHRLSNMPLLAHGDTGAQSTESKLERFHYTPGSFRFGNKGPNDTPFADDKGRTRTDTDEAKRIADQAATAAVARSKRFAFDSNALDMTAGMLLKVQGHPVADKEGELLISRVVLSGTTDTEPHLTVSAVNKATGWRPEVVTPSPRVQGVECATVTGPAGETIHTDEFGRVRVQFHWDRYGKMDENSSLWIHVNQQWSGEGMGSINLPRIGQEVLVGFLGGDPEEPVVVGRMHTNLKRPPFALPANKTQSGLRSASVAPNGGDAGTGYNEMMFEDKLGGELIRMHGEKDMAMRINNDHSSSIGRDRQATIERHDTETVQGNQTEQVDGQHQNSVGLDQLLSVGGSMLSMTGLDRVLQTTGASSSAAATHAITSQTSTTISVGASMIYIGPDAIVIQSPKILLNPGEEVASAVAMGGPVPSPAQ